MIKKRLTQKYPWMLPIRKKQRVFCFYLSMYFDKNHYAKVKTDKELEFIVSEVDCPMVNHKTGFDIQYQQNKIFNCSLASNTMNKIVIGPGETYSFWKLVKNADKSTPYKDGLVVVDGKTTTAYGGGLCQLSNLLFNLFLRSPLSIVERVGHRVKEFPELSNDVVLGIDATIAEGWIDLKIKNDTTNNYQIQLIFEGEDVKAVLRCDKENEYNYEILNKNLQRYVHDGKVVEEVDVWRRMKDKETHEMMFEEMLYHNCCILGYENADGKIMEKKI